MLLAYKEVPHIYMYVYYVSSNYTPHNYNSKVLIVSYIVSMKCASFHGEGQELGRNRNFLVQYIYIGHNFLYIFLQISEIFQVPIGKRIGNCALYCTILIQEIWQ